MKKLMAAMIMSAAVLAVAAPACADVFTTDDGVLSIETPADQNWAVTPDPKYWFVITNGNDSILIDHLANGENLPAVQVASETYPGVYQSFVSTANEVFVVKALASQVDDLQNLMGITGTLRVLKFNTKTAVTTTDKPASSQFGLRTINKTYVVTGDEVNVRSGCSTDDAVIGSITKGQEVLVLGAVTLNGADYGWYQISYGGGTGYVSAAFLSEGKGGSAKDNKNDSKAPTAVEFDVWDANGKPQGKLREKDGYYYSNDGFKYEYIGFGSFRGEAGDLLFNYKPEQGSTNPIDRAGAFTVWDGSGRIQGSLAPDPDSAYYESNDGQLYRSNGNGSYYGIDTGDTLYDYDPTAGAGEVEDEDIDPYDYEFSREITSQETGESVYVYSTDDESYEWTDADGTRYQNNGDGTYTDYYGNEYNWDED